MLQGLEAGGDLVCWHCWRVVVPATALPDIDNGWLALRRYRVGRLGRHLLSNVSCGMPCHILSRLKLAILDCLLESILVDVHLRTDDEHFGLVVSVAFGRSAVDLLIVSTGLGAVTAQRGAVRDLHVLVPRWVMRRRLRLDVRLREDASIGVGVLVSQLLV